jgi:hypothetical protein
MVSEPVGGGTAANRADAPPGVLGVGQFCDDRTHTRHRNVPHDRAGTRNGRRPRRGCQPQHSAPAATASAFAADPQQLPDSCASAAVPQHVLAAGAGEEVDVGSAVPQQPPAAGGLNASAGSPANPPEIG